MATPPIKITIKAIDRISKTFRGIQKSSKRLENGFKKVSNRVRLLSSAVGIPRLTKAFKRLGGAMGRAGALAGQIGRRMAVGMSAAALAIGALINKTATLGDNLAKSADRTGLTVKAYQELGFAARRAGMSQAEFDKTVTLMVRNVGDLKNNMGTLTTALKKYDPALAAALKGSKGTAEAMDIMFEAVDKIEDPTLKASIATAAFGRNGAKVINLLKDGPEGVKKLREEFRALGGAMSEEGARNSEKFQDSMEDLKTSLGSITNAIAETLLPALTKLIKELQSFFSDPSTRAQIKEFMQSFADGVPSVKAIKEGIVKFIDGVKPLASFVGKVVDNLGALKTIALVLAGPLLIGLIGAVASLGTAFVALGVAIGFTPLGLILGGLALVGGAIALVISSWDELVEGFKSGFGIIDFLSEKWDNLGASISGALDNIKDFVTNNPLTRGLGSIGETVGGFFGDDEVATPPPPPATIIQSTRSDFVNTNNAKIEVSVQGGAGTQATIVQDSANVVELNTGVSMLTP